MSLSSLVTLVIPAHARPGQTLGLLRSLAASGARYPVVLVDDGSPMPLEPVVQAVPELSVRYVRNATPRGPSAARNAGLSLAETQFVAFTDNDVEVTERWMEALVDHMRNAPADVAGVGGRVVDDGRTLVGEYCTRLGLLDPFIQRGRVMYLVTANCLFRRSAVLSVGGFDEVFLQPGGEDPDLSFRLIKKGYRLEYEPQAVVRHSYSRSWIAFAKMFRRYGSGCRRAMEALAST